MAAEVGFFRSHDRTTALCAVFSKYSGETLGPAAVAYTYLKPWAKEVVVIQPFLYPLLGKLTYTHT